ncbi:small ribosomal subunit biogenesis GTPase RsgA [Aphanothece hegewaldii]|uniref:small ribosomal subunit biogenesis GTPase RsgA n=1 Tax=Aphanothece hegewaldii TaxID=1521625 RepID=UPI001C62C148|nr:small ribosomal subunit biogenesis GTPase RsgA [Aphanothece hegewaldii]
MSEKPITSLYGTVLAVQANYYHVKLDTNELEDRCLLCTRRTRLKKIGQKVMVGDRVLVTEPDFQDGRGAISEVLQRKTELSRPPVANAEQILLVFALEEPSLDPWQLSRFLIKAESTALTLCLCLNKSDLISPQQQQAWQNRLNGWGYQSIFLSVTQDLGIEELLSRLQNKISILAGPSGVGKSSLINRLIPNIEQRVGSVSGKLLKGRHTTRHVELFDLPNSGLIADTPGFNQPDVDCTPDQLAYLFPEARQRLSQGNCQFNDCLHRLEPNCVVRGDWERYEHYLKFLEEAIVLQSNVSQLPDEETNLKLKVKSLGQSQYEPKLESKKYRRPSRKQNNQFLQERYENQNLRDLADTDEDW